MTGGAALLGDPLGSPSAHSRGLAHLSGNSSVLVPFLGEQSLELDSLPPDPVVVVRLAQQLEYGVLGVRLEFAMQVARQLVLLFGHQVPVALLLVAQLR